VPTIQSPGIGSGIDVNSLVERLVTAEIAPRGQRLTSREVRITTQISALGTLKGGLGAFKAALESLKTPASFNPRKATASDDKAFTAAAGNSAAPGSYSIEIVALARAHQLSSAVFAGGSTTTVGTGTLTITVGSASFDVVIDATKNTVVGIRDAVNAAIGNSGVQATIVNESGGARLLFTSTATGAAKALRVTTSGGDGGLSQLVYDPPTTTNLTQIQAAQDAHVRIAGFNHFSATNVVTGAIDDVTLTLKTAAAGTILTLDVGYDTAAVIERAKKLVAEHNALYGQIAKLRSYTPETRAAGPLLGDAMLRGIEEQIRRGLTDIVTAATGAYNSLASVGITKQTNGTLALDETKLNAALAADRNAVANVFGATDGVALRLFQQIEARLASGADLSARDQLLQKDLQGLKTEREALDRRATALEDRFRKQFTALDTLLSQLQSTSNYLAQQLAALPTRR
jgi:flagellar hook-associated protein 2